MKFKEVMAELKSFGTEQNRKVYARHGASKNMFGVSFANIYKIEKKIKKAYKGEPEKQHGLAISLWESKNDDAMNLATLVLIPDMIDMKMMEDWISKITYFMCEMMLSNPLAETPWAKKAATKWTKKKEEYFRAVGYNIISRMLKDNPDSWDDEECRQILSTIESEIHTSENRARYAMNNTVIAIGGYKDKLTKETTQVAKHIGKVHVDHGTTGCKTPDACEYIQKVIKRRKK